MIYNKLIRLSFSRDIFWSFALLLFFAISMNSDWSKSSVVWYGSLALVVFSYIFVYERFRVTLSSFSIWLLSFITLGMMSLVWSISISTGFVVIKNLIVLFALFFFIQLSIDCGYDINTMLKCYFIATIINAIYVFLNIDIEQLGEVQVGTGLLDGWNGNGIGFMMSQGALIGVYLLGQYKDVINRILLVSGITALVALTMYTGSRTAFVLLVCGIVLYFWLKKPSKLLRNIFITAVLIYIAFYLIMNVEAFYNVLGSRFEGLFALFSGNGKVDGSSNVRNIFIQNGKIWFKENPILGYGINNYKELNKQATGRFTYAHNTFIEIAVDLGIVGLALYYFAYLYIAIRLVKKVKNNPTNAFVLSSILASLISHYGNVSYYDFYQNMLLMLGFYFASSTNNERVGKLL